MRLPGQIVVACWLALWLTAPLAAQEEPRLYREGGGWAEEVSGSLPAARTLKIHTTNGNLQVTGAAQPNITYVIKKRVYKYSEEGARRELARFRVIASSHGDVAIIEGQSEWGPSRMSADFQITVPRGTEMVRAHTDGGNLALEHLNGKTEAESGGGNLSIEDIGGSVSALTGGGNVYVGETHGEVKVSTGGGNMHISSAGGRVLASSGGGNVEVGNTTAEVRLSTGGGSVRVTKCSRLQAETGGGNIELGEADGPVGIETGGGGIRVGSARGAVRAQSGGGGIELYKLGQSAEAETGAGSIVAEFVAERGKFESSRLESGAGDIVVYLPDNLPVTVRADVDAAYGHHIRSDFPEFKLRSESGDFGPRELYGEGDLNGGGPLLKIHTSTGNIELRRGRR